MTTASTSTSKTPARTYSKRASNSSSFFSPKTYTLLTREGSAEADLEGKENSSQEIPTTTVATKYNPSSDNELGSSAGQQHTISRGNFKRNNSLGGSPDGDDDYSFDLASDKKLSSSQSNSAATNPVLRRKNSGSATYSLSRSNSADVESGLKKRKSSAELKNPTAKSTSFSELTNSGSNRSLLDEVEYMLEGMNTSQPLTIRRLSAYNLTKLCSKSDELSFLFRAHGLFEKVIDLLHGSIADEVLFMCAASTLYFMFKDKLNCEYVSSAALKLIITLLSPEGSVTGSSSAAVVVPVKKLFALAKSPEDMLRDIKKLFLLEDNELSDESMISAPALAMCTLAQMSALQLSLRDDLRKMGLLDIITARLERLLHAHASASDNVLSSECALFEAANCLRILENVTFQNTESQHHLANITQLAPCLLALLRASFEKIVPKQASVNNKKAAKGKRTPKTPPPAAPSSSSTPNPVISECLQLSLKVLVNLTNHNQTACVCVAENSGLETVLEILNAFRSNATENFDTWLLAIGCLSNLLEETPTNRDRLSSIVISSGQNAIEFLVQLYLDKAQQQPPGATVATTSPAPSSASSSAPSEQMEANVAAAYCALMLGCVVRENADNRQNVLARLPERSFEPLVNVIGDFIGFQLQNGVLSREAHQSYVHILLVLDPTAGKGTMESTEAANVSSA